MKNNVKKALIYTLGAVLLLFSCFYMYDFYKCLSGFIANGFREASVMLPMVLSFFLPVLCFLFFFYDFYVKSVHRVAKIVFSSVVILWASVNLGFVFSNISLYASNNRFGVYDALPSIIVHFPYDMIIVHSALILLAVFDIFCAAKSDTPPAIFIKSFEQSNLFKLKIWEYLPLCVLAILVFVFSGAAVTATFTALSNAFYDFRYVFLLLWVGLIPLINLAYLVAKPEKLIGSKLSAGLTLGAGIFTNVIFALLLLIFELTYPDFMVHIGKPLFLIAFSVSLPIEMGVILGIQAIGTVAMTTKLILTLVNKNKA